MAVNIRRTAIAAGVLAAAIVIVLTIFGGLFYLMSAGMRSEINSLKIRVAKLEK